MSNGEPESHGDTPLNSSAARDFFGSEKRGRPPVAARLLNRGHCRALKSLENNDFKVLAQSKGWARPIANRTSFFTLNLVWGTAKAPGGGAPVGVAHATAPA